MLLVLRDFMVNTDKDTKWNMYAMMATFSGYPLSYDRLINDGFGQDCTQLTAIALELLKCCINCLRPSDAIWRQRTGSTLDWIMVWCLMAQSHYLHLCWLYISNVLWHSCEDNFTETSAINQQNYVENYFSRIFLKSPRGQLVHTDSQNGLVFEFKRFYCNVLVESVSGQSVKLNHGIDWFTDWLLRNIKKNLEIERTNERSCYIITTSVIAWHIAVLNIINEVVYIDVETSTQFNANQCFYSWIEEIICYMIS